jgi:CrcB protein
MGWLAVAVGGAVGSLARYAVGQLVQTRAVAERFPFGTMTVNICGCFAIGLLAGLLVSERLVWRAEMREFVFVGLLGGFTTYSAFGLDTFLLARAGGVGPAVLNVALQLSGGLMAVWLGYHLGERGW